MAQITSNKVMKQVQMLKKGIRAASISHLIQQLFLMSNKKLKLL